MCGIAGAWNVKNVGAIELDCALDTISHRGPDGKGALVRGGVMLGMCRLAIIDTVGGGQPVYNEDQTAAAVFNGEIYNYLELRRELISEGHSFKTASDTEVIVHLYEKHGPSFASRLRGMFAIALWDDERRRLIISRDRLGKKPLYYRRCAGGGVLFASELKALRVLISAAHETCEMSPDAVAHYLSLGAVPQPLTIYKDVFCLTPGSALICSQNGVREEKYWSIDDYTAGESVCTPEELRTCIAESVKLRLRSDVPVGVFLSGGLDSTIVAYEASLVLKQPIKTFTVQVDDPTLDESNQARETANAFGAQHHNLHIRARAQEGIEFVVKHYDQPFADASAIPSYFISKAAAEHVKVVLTGDGGDEFFAGYRRHVASRWSGISPIFRPFSWLGGVMHPNHRRSRLGFVHRFARAAGSSFGEKYLMWSTDMLRDAHKRYMPIGQNLQPTESFIESAVIGVNDELRRIMLTDLAVNLRSVLLVKMDMASMAASIEARSPLLDHKLLELSQRVPSGQLVSGLTGKAFLRRAYHDKLPPTVLRGRKKGFEIPMQAWLSGELRELLEETLLSKDPRCAEFVGAEFPRALAENRSAFDGNRNQMLYALLVLELWLRKQKALTL